MFCGRGDRTFLIFHITTQSKVIGFCGWELLILVSRLMLIGLNIEVGFDGYILLRHIMQSHN